MDNNTEQYISSRCLPICIVHPDSLQGNIILILLLSFTSSLAYNKAMNTIGGYSLTLSYSSIDSNGL